MSRGDGTILIWDSLSAKEGRIIGDPEEGADGIYPVAFVAGGARLASARNSDYVIKLWDSSSGKEVATLPGHKEFVSTLAVSADGSLLASGSSDGTSGTITLWDTSDTQEIRSLPGEWPEIQFLPAENGLKEFVTIALTPSRTVELWCAEGDPRNWRTLGPLFGPEDHITEIAFSSHASRVASVDYSGRTKIWDVVSRPIAGAPAACPSAKLAPVTYEDSHMDFRPSYEAVMFSADGRSLLRAEDDTIVILNAATGETIRRPSEHGVVNGLAISADGSILATANHDGTVTFRDVRRGDWKTVGTLSVGGSVYSLAFSPDGKRLAVSSYPGGEVESRTVTLWETSSLSDASNRKPLLTLPDLQSPAISADGKYLAAVRPLGSTAQIFALNPATLLRIVQDRVQRPLSDEECRHYFPKEGCPLN